MPDDKHSYTRFSISLPNELLATFDEFIQRKGLNRSDAIRKAMRLLVATEEWDDLEGVKAGSITIIADHDYEHESTHVQHHFKDVIVSTTHVHLPSDNCLEILALNGDAKRIKVLYDELVAIKGVLTTGFTILK